MQSQINMLSPNCDKLHEKENIETENGGGVGWCREQQQQLTMRGQDEEKEGQNSRKGCLENPKH